MKIKKLNEGKILRRETLLEDKVVKFDGEVYPKFGWCTIMCGAPASGKSTVLGNLIPVNAKIYDPDRIKEFAVEKGEIVDNALVVGKNKYPLDDIEPPFTLSNPKFLDFLHKKLKPINNKIRDNLFNIGISAEEGRLPNIAFDITGSDMDDFENIFVHLAPIGYKFCIVWVFNTLETSLKNNEKRDRKVEREILINKYFHTLVTIPGLLKRQDLMSLVSDFWIVLPVEYELKTDSGRYMYIKADNVERIDPQNNDGSLSYKITNMVYEQQSEILRKYKNEIQNL